MVSGPAPYAIGVVDIKSKACEGHSPDQKRVFPIVASWIMIRPTNCGPTSHLLLPLPRLFIVYGCVINRI